MLMNTISDTMYDFLQSQWTGNSKLKGIKEIRCFRLYQQTKALPPMAMGLTSGAQWVLILFSAVNAPPTRNLAMSLGALPEARRLTMLFREEQIEIVRGMEAASRRY